MAALTVFEALKKTGLARTTFIRKVEALNIPKINRGGKVFYEEEILERYFPSKGPGFAKIICFANQKGGIGKTTSCLNTAIALSKLSKEDGKKHKIAVIDFDAQSNLTGQFVKSPEDLKNTIANLLDLKIHGFHNAKVDDTVIDTGYFDLFPSSIALANFETSRDLMDYDKLKIFTDTLRGAYDWIFIDCGPSLDIKILNALVCSDYVIIPNTPSKFSVQGLSFLKNTIDKAKNKNPTLKAYSLINQFVEKHQISAMTDRITDFFPVLSTIIPRATDIEKSQVVEEHLDTYAPAKFKYYTELAKEVIAICQN